MVCFSSYFGAKNQIAHEIIKHFPRHDFYVEPFCGVCSVFLNKDKAKYNILNDLNNDIYNLFFQIQNNLEEFINFAEEKLITQNYILKKIEPENALDKALQFYLNTNCTYLSQGSCLFNSMMIFNFRQRLKNFKEILKYYFIKDTFLLNEDYKRVFTFIKSKNYEDKNVFVYCDPPYFGTSTRKTDNQREGKSNFNTEDLIKCCIESNYKFAISEFSSKINDDLIKKYNLNKIEVLERKLNINKDMKKTEILITNYKQEGEQIDLFKMQN